MFAKPLEEYEVVYFIFPNKAAHSFWNKNVDFPLTLAFLDDNHKIVDFKELDKQSPKSVSPNHDEVKFVVEANKDMFKKLNVNIGDKLIVKGKKLLLEKKDK